MIKVYRHFHLSGAVGADIRTATFDDREHLVVPVVALMEGVIWPVNAPSPEFVSAEVLAVAPQSWNGVAVVMDHPTDGNGRQVSANSPRILETYSFGRVFNTASTEHVLKTKRLPMEAWLDISRAARVGKDAEDVLRRAREKEPIEVSVGAYVVMNEQSGEYSGQKYGGSWLEVFSDHLAMLPQGATGACSVEMGCGAPRAASGKCPQCKGSKLMPERAMSDPQGQLPCDMCGGTGLPPVTAGRARVHLVSARGIEMPTTEQQQSPESLALNDKGAGMKTREERIAAMKDSGKLSDAAMQACAGTISDVDLSALEGAVASAKDGEKVDVPAPVVKRTLRQRFMDLLSKFTAGDGVSDNELRDALSRALQSTVPGYLGIPAVYPEEKQVVYAAAPDDSIEFWRCSYAMADDGKVTLGSEREKVKRVEKWEAMSAEPATGTQRSACGCGGAKATEAAAAAPANPSEGDKNMDKAQRIKALIDNKKTPWKAADQSYLEGMSDERLTEVEQSAKEEEEPAAVTTPAVTTTEPAATTAAATTVAAKEETEEQQMAKLPKSVREMVARVAARDAAHKTSLVTALAATQKEYNEAELKDMSVESLERMSRLLDAEVDVPSADFTGRGFPRAASTTSDYLTNPPNGYKVALEKRAARKE